MNGGYIKQQRPGEHQIVTFIFTDELTEAQVEQWNLAIRQLKTAFGNHITGATVFAQPTSFDDPDWAKGRR
jgi:hypothetical protein